MKVNIIKLLGLMFLTAVCGACSENSDIQEEVSGKVLEMRVSSGMLSTSRTVLPGSENVQHVTRIALYLFRHDTPDDTLGAVYVGKMSFDEVNWNQNLKEAITDGNSTLTQRVALPKEWFADADPETWFTFLAVGSDETFTESPNLSSAVTWNNDNATKAYGLNTEDLTGKTLGDCYAELYSQAAVADIRQAELFAGTLTVQEAQINVNTVIALNRRVAGVKGFFCKIPHSVNGQTVGAVRVVYWKPQPTAVPYFVRQPENGIFMDYDRRTPLPADFSIPEAGGQFASLQELESCTYFTIPKEQFTQNDAGYVTEGSYVLPAPTAEGDDHSTLCVLLMAEDGLTVLNKRRVLFKSSVAVRASLRGATDQGTGIIDGQPADEEELKKRRHYPIVANNYYSIGTEEEPIDLSTDDVEVGLYVDPTWEGYHQWDEIVNIPN